MKSFDERVEECIEQMKGECQIIKKEMRLRENTPENVLMILHTFIARNRAFTALLIEDFIRYSTNINKTLEYVIKQRKHVAMVKRQEKKWQAYWNAPLRSKRKEERQIREEKQAA